MCHNNPTVHLHNTPCPPHLMLSIVRRRTYRQILIIQITRKQVLTNQITRKEVLTNQITQQKGWGLSMNTKERMLPTLMVRFPLLVCNRIVHVYLHTPNKRQINVKFLSIPNNSQLMGLIKWDHLPSTINQLGHDSRNYLVILRHICMWFYAAIFFDFTIHVFFLISCPWHFSLRKKGPFTIYAISCYGVYAVLLGLA